MYFSLACHSAENTCSHCQPVPHPPAHIPPHTMPAAPLNRTTSPIPDCSQRICPYDFAWADSALGDLNHDGIVSPSNNAAVQQQHHTTLHQEYFPTDAAYQKARPEEAHFYAECSNAGVCDRTTGQCECFEGFTGAACQRMTCPNDCSAHGVCRTMADVTSQALTRRDVGANGDGIVYGGVVEPFEYKNWDANKTHVCVCDGGYTGPDCSHRLCPRGDDPLTIESRNCGSADCQPQYQVMLINNALSIANGHNALGASVTIKYTHWNGITYTTAAHAISPGAANADNEPVQIKYWLEHALEGLPDGVIKDVEVHCFIVTGNTACDASTDTTQNVKFVITFKQPSGFLPDLTLAYQAITPNSHTTAKQYIIMSPVAAGFHGNKERVECSDRGLCDYSTGLCDCFDGYFGDNCSIASANAKRSGSKSSSSSGSSSSASSAGTASSSSSGNAAAAAAAVGASTT